GLLTTIPTRALRIWFPDTTTFRQSTRMPSRTALRAVAASMEVGISQSTELPSTTAEFAESGVGEHRKIPSMNAPRTRFPRTIHPRLVPQRKPSIGQDAPASVVFSVPRQ